MRLEFTHEQKAITGNMRTKSLSPIVNTLQSESETVHYSSNSNFTNALLCFPDLFWCYFGNWHLKNLKLTLTESVSDSFWRRLQYGHRNLSYHKFDAVKPENQHTYFQTINNKNIKKFLLQKHLEESSPLILGHLKCNLGGGNLKNESKTGNYGESLC